MIPSRFREAQGLRKPPPDECRRSGGNDEDQKEDRQFFGDRVAGPRHPEPHVDCSNDEPEWNKEPRRRRCGLWPAAKPPAGEREQAKQDEAPGDDNRCAQVMFRWSSGSQALLRHDLSLDQGSVDRRESQRLRRRRWRRARRIRVRAGCAKSFEGDCVGDRRRRAWERSLAQWVDHGRFRGFTDFPRTPANAS